MLRRGDRPIGCGAIAASRNFCLLPVLTLLTPYCAYCLLPT
jgi:hypothetical protein